MELIFAPAAAKAIARMPAREGAALLAKLQQVAAEPAGSYPWAKRLSDHPGFRVRQGDWRALYRLDGATGQMVVDRIARRAEAYR